MCIHKNIFYSSLLILFLLTAGCATSYAPDNWLPETDKVPQNNYGGWITVIVDESKDETEEKYTHIETIYQPTISKTLTRYLQLSTSEAKSIEELKDIVLRVENKINSLKENWN